MDNEIKYSITYQSPEKVMERAGRVLGIIEDQLYILSQLFESRIIIPDVQTETGSKPVGEK